MFWPDLAPIETVRCRLEPLSPAQAESMVDVLGDPGLYRFTGGGPPTLDELRRRYRAQSVGHSADGRQWWCNWVVTLRAEQRQVGYVQATVEHTADALEAVLAWVIQPPDQRTGLATEAATAMMTWLSDRGVAGFTALIHPDHAASARVAAKLGMHRTTVTDDGEIRWESARSAGRVDTCDHGGATNGEPDTRR